MSVKEPVNFRLDRDKKEALSRLAAQHDRALSELLRDLVEEYLSREERRAWEADARRASLALAEEAKDQKSAESEMLATLEANLEEFAQEWIWDDEP